MDSDRSSRGIYGLASANSALDGIPFKIGGKFKVPNKVSIPKELLARRKCSALDDEYFFNTEEGVIHWAKAQQRMKESKEQVMREREAAAAALNKQCLAEAEMKSQQVLMPVASEDVYANIHNMADKMLTPTPISQHQITISSNSTDTNTNMSQFDVSQFEREDDPFENVERQVINEFEELNQVFQKSAESSESPEGNYENVVVVSKPAPDAAAPPPLPPPPLPPPPLPPPPGSAAAAAAAAASASAEHESPRHVPLGSQAAPIENSTTAAEPETTHVEISGNGPDENSEAEFDDENAIYGNLPCRKKSTTGSPKRKDSNNYVMVSYANGRLVRDASKRQAIAAARQSSLDEELKSKIVMSNSLNQKTCTVPASVVSGNSEESMGLSPDATILSEGIYENMPVSSPDKNNYENCFLAQRSRHSVAFDGDSPVCPPAIPPRTDLAKLRGTHSTPNIHQASSGKDAKSVSPFKSPPSPMPRKQSWSRHPPVPPIRSRHNGQVSQSSVETSCSDDSPTDCSQVNDPFPNMSQEAQNFVQQYLTMGFPRARVARAVEKLGLDEKEVIDHLCMVDKLGEEGHDPQLVEDALHLFENDIQKAECYIHLHQQFVELGFQRSKIQEALVTSKLDSDKALDLLTT